MSEAPRFLTIEDVLALHQHYVELYGGEPDLLSIELLESAVMMPQASFGGEYLHQGLAAMAAAYLFHLCKNHAFLDGNKRVALAAAGAFLLFNGKFVRATSTQLERLTMRVAEGRITKDELTRFFEDRLIDAR